MSTTMTTRSANRVQEPEIDLTGEKNENFSKIYKFSNSFF